MFPHCLQASNGHFPIFVWCTEFENICRPDLYSGAQVSPLKPEPAPQVSRLFQFRGEVLLRPGLGAFSKRNMFLQQ